VAPNKRADNKKMVGCYADAKLIEHFRQSADFFGVSVTELITNFMKETIEDFERQRRNKVSNSLSPATSEKRHKRNIRTTMKKKFPTFSYYRDIFPEGFEGPITASQLCQLFALLEDRLSEHVQPVTYLSKAKLAKIIGCVPSTIDTIILRLEADRPLDAVSVGSHLHYNKEQFLERIRRAPQLVQTPYGLKTVRQYL